MQILITHGGLARSRVLRFNRLQLAGFFVVLVLLLTLLSGTVYHFVFLKAAREGWPVVSQVVKLVVRDEFAQRDRYMRENLDAMAQKVGEMQAKLIKLEAMSDRVSGLAGVKAGELQQLAKPPTGGAGKDARPALPAGQGGPFVPARSLSLDQINAELSTLDERADFGSDVLTVIEARLFERRMQALMIPTARPVDGPVGSGFGFRADPFSGRAALHTGLDFPAESGTTIVAAAGGLVLSTEYHPQYGNLIEVDHGNGLVTRYAHTSKVMVKAGDIIKRGQVIALVGSSGRSTGPHLHFEVMVEGVLQDPAKFLAAAGSETRAGAAPGAPLAAANGLAPGAAAARR